MENRSVVFYAAALGRAGRCGALDSRGRAAGVGLTGAAISVQCIRRPRYRSAIAPSRASRTTTVLRAGAWPLCRATWKYRVSYRTTLVKHLNLQGSSEFFKVVQIGGVTFKRYSMKALDELQKALKTVDMAKVWSLNKPTGKPSAAGAATSS